MNIPLQVSVPNYLDTIDHANRAAAFKDGFNHRRKLRNFLDEAGPRMYHGDQNALAGYARFDPGAAMGIKQAHQQMRHADQRLKLAQAAGARAAANARLGREEKERTRQEYDQLRQLALLRESDPGQFARGLNTLGLTQQGVTPENFDIYLATAQGAAGELFGAIQEARPQPQAPQSSLGKIQADIDAGLLPSNTPLRSNPVNINNSVSTGGKFSEQLDKNLADDLIASREKAASAATLIRTINDGRAVLDRGAITGAGSNYVVSGLKLAETLGVPVPIDAANNTETFKAVMGNAVGQIIKQFGAGTGLSDADRQYALQIAGGDTTLNEPAIRRIFDIAERASRTTISNYQGRADAALSGDRSRLLSVEAPLPIQSPQTAQPAPRSTPMTFEEFSAAPSAKAAAQKHGVTLEDMWEMRLQLEEQN